MKTNTSESFDAKLRCYTYQQFVQHARAPKVSEAAQALGVAESEARAGYQRLTEGHAIMLTEPNGELWHAASFSAVPTAFRALRRELLVCQLRLGRAGHPRRAASGRHQQCHVQLLQ